MRVCLVLFACLPLALCEVHKFELNDVANAHKLEYHVATSRPREMSKEEIHKELQLLRQRRSSGQPVSYSYPFNDQHSSGIVSYSGTDQQVVFLLTYDLVGGVPSIGTNLYKSTDYGKTFLKINNRLEGSGTLRLWNNFFVSPEDYNQIVFPHATQSKMYVTTNEGGTFKTVSLPHNINPRSLNFNPSKGDRFLGVGGQNLWVSEDLGDTYTQVASSVVAFDWGVPGIDSASTVYFWGVPVGSTGSYLYSIDKPYSSAKLLDTNLGTIEGYAMVGSFIFTQKSDASGTISLWVSNKRGQFHQALIPSTIAHQNYFVTSIQDYQALVIVEHVDNVYTLYMSGEDGEVFSESLPNVYATSSGNNGPVTFDIELLDSMNGTFVANQILSSGTSSSDASLRSLISFDNGGNWNIVQPPTTFLNGSLVNCEPPACSLHFHMATSEYWRTGVYSQASAPGIIIAHGSIGSQLSDNPDLYLSRDGGITWSQTLLSTWGVSVLDHGGLIVAAADYHQSRSSIVQYTCNEGLTWSTYNYSQLLTVWGVVTEPGETTTVVALYGWENNTSGWITVLINFTNIFDHQCADSDYYDWEPYDENLDVDCLNGATVVIERRKPDSCCLNGQEYVRQLSYSHCECTTEDYQCDYGYVHSEGFTGPCVPDETVDLEDTCTGDETYYVQSTGYRKIPGDVCENGVSSQYKAFTVQCCAPPSTVTTTETATSISTSYTNTITTVYSGATATATILTTITNTIYLPSTTTTTAFGVCSASPVQTSTSDASSSSTDTRTVFLAVFIVVLAIAIGALVVVTIILGIKLHKKGTTGYSSVSTHYRAEVPLGSSGRETSPGVAINHAADDSDEGDKDDDLLIP